MNIKNPTKEFVTSFCKEYDVEVCHDRTVEFCPCRFKLRTSYFCNFNQMLVDLCQEKRSLRYKRFFKLICEENRRELESTDFLSKDIQLRMENFVKDVKSGRIKVGDFAYCTTLDKDVKILELPEEKYFDIYRQFGVFPGDVKYKTLDGEIGLAPVATINKISKGEYVADYILDRKENSSEEKVEHLGRLAKRTGLRVKITKTEALYKIEFKGDTQREVDEFVELCKLPQFLSI